MGGGGGGQRVCCPPPPPPKLLGGLAPLGPPSSYAYVIVKLGPLTQRSFSLNHHSIKYILPSLSTSFCFLRGLLDVSHFLVYTIVTPFPLEIPPKAFYFILFFFYFIFFFFCYPWVALATFWHSHFYIFH